MLGWIQRPWQAFLASFDVEELTHVSSSALLGVGCIGAVCSVLAIAGYVPSIARVSQFTTPGTCITLAVAGGLCTFSAGRLGYRGLLGGLLALVDNTLYSASLALAAVTSANGFDVGFAAVHGLMIVGFFTQLYSLSLLLALGITLPPALLMLAFRPAPAVVIIVVCSSLMALLLMYQTGKRQEIARGARRLELALGETDRVLDATMQRALTMTLLDLGNFLHELRNVQTAVRMNLEFLKEQRGLDMELSAAVQDALDASRTEQILIDETIDDLRRQARPRSGRVVLDTVLREVLDGAGSNPKIVLSGSCPGFEIVGEPGHLSSVLRNLLRNARHAGASRIEIRVQLEPNAGAVELTVQDNGPGIPKERLPKLFQPFVSSNKIAGTGLGLYLSRRYVELMHGSIDAENVAGGGARFRIRLPGQLLARSAEVGRQVSKVVEAEAR